MLIRSPVELNNIIFFHLRFLCQFLLAADYDINILTFFVLKMTKLEVIVRVRPVKKDQEIGLYVTDDRTITLKNRKGSQSQFTFSRVYDQSTAQEKIFGENVHDLINTAIEGRNVSILSYGPTGTGKTYTMVGNEKNPGIIPR